MRRARSRQSTGHGTGTPALSAGEPCKATPALAESCRGGKREQLQYAARMALPYPGVLDATGPVPTVRAEYGAVFTKRWVVDLILDLCAYQPDVDLTALRVVEPAVGAGAFLAPVVERLLAARAKYGAHSPWLALDDCIRGWDLQAEHVEAAKRLVVEQLVDAGCPQSAAVQLADAWLHVGDFLLADHQRGADLVVGNPPYIRIEDIPVQLLASYRAACPCMGGRADVFVGFYEHGLDLLAEGGRLAYICADRWMRNAYGRKLRRKILDGPYSVDAVLTMHDSAAFDAEVSAYPAITVIRRGGQGPVVTGLANERFGPEEAHRFAAWAGASPAEVLDSAAVTGAVLPGWHRNDDSWPEGSPEVLQWLEELAESLPLLEDQAAGTRIGIGVATGADSVYIRQADELPAVETDRLLPLTMAADLKTGRFMWTGHHLVSPWESAGVVDLRSYPKLAAYYREHRATLLRRNVAGRSGDRWYRTIDRVNYDLLSRPMLVMEDMKAQGNPVLVPPGYYPHHNLYYIVSDEWDLEALGGLLLSEVIERQVAAYCVKMRGSTLRFQAQYLRRVRCPQPGTVAPETLDALASAFRARDRTAATKAALDAFGLDSLPA